MSDESTAVAVVEKPKTAAVGKPGSGKVSTSDVSLTPDQVITAALTSGYYKHIRTKADGYIIAAYGAALGMDLTTALSSIILVQGRMTLSANYIAALVKKSGRYRYRVKSKTDKACSIEFFEKVVNRTKEGVEYWEWESAGIETFTCEMAKRAGLVKPGSNWMAWPEAMCFARAMTAGVRTFCPDLMLGQSVYTPDELDPNIKMTMTGEGDVVPDAEYVQPSKSEPPLPSEFAAEVRKLLTATASDEASFLKALTGVDTADRLTPAQAQKAIQVLQEKHRSQPKGG